MKKKLLIAMTTRLSFRFNHKPLFFLTVPFELSNSVGPSYVQWRRWSYATAAVPSDTPNSQKSQKKILKHERRAMVESFVNKYRTMNDGKFPSVTDVKKQVGGSFYIVREIIGELKYKSKMNSSNSMADNLLRKEQRPKVSLDNTGTAKKRPIQDDSQLVLLDDQETIDAGYEHLEEKRGSQMSAQERRLSKEVEIVSTPGNHCIASESNLLEKRSDEPYPSSLQVPNDVETEEAVSSNSDCVARPPSHLPQEGEKHVSSPFSDKYGTGYEKAPGHESEFVDMDNQRIMQESCIKKAGYERREQPSSEDLYKEPSHSSMQVSNDVKSGKDVSNYSSDSVAPERHPIKEEIEHVSASFIEKSGSSHSKAQSHDSKFVGIENHPIVEEKSLKKQGYEKKDHVALEDLPSVDCPNHKMEQSQGSIEMDASKMKNSNNRETSVVADSEKTTLWGNLKSFADGIINIWRKL